MHPKNHQSAPANQPASAKPAGTPLHTGRHPSGSPFFSNMDKLNNMDKLDNLDKLDNMDILNSRDKLKKIENTLEQHAIHTGSRHIKTFFEENPQRFTQFTLHLDCILYDYSKQRLDREVLESLLDLASAAGLQQWIDRLFQGEPINHTEHRAALHWALRLPQHAAAADLHQLDQAVVDGIHAQIGNMRILVDQLQQGQYRGCSGEVITDVVNIGVGGSDLGPLMVSRALEDYRVSSPQNLQLHFVSSMDGSQVSQLLQTLRPETTLFIISSKSFTTIDTLYNAETARSWLARRLGSGPEVAHCHFVGVSTNRQKMNEWGISPSHQLDMWDWVGGRFSLWSAIGFPIALTIGMQGFTQLLAGAHFMDQHFKQAPWHQNLPVLMALIGIWNSNFLKINTQAVLPYDGRLEYLAAYLQQLEMESNGKSVDRQGSRVQCSTCPIIWGDVGPNAQHAFYQLLHQGTQTIACDFIAPALRYHASEKQHAESANELQAQHQLALANCLAQSRLLAFGEAALNAREGDLPVYKRYHGNQPSSTLLLKELNPYNLGALLAAYEHKVFVQSVIWNINPFDQWGVEMGKEIARELLPALTGNAGGHTSSQRFDSSTHGLLAFIKS